jgi:SlyX protein
VAKNSDMEQLQEQVVELQSQLAFQEDTIGALNEVVTRQQAQIENLHEWQLNQKEQLQSINDEMSKDVVDEKPPHY